MSKKMYMPVNVTKEYDNGRSSVYWGNNNYLCVNSKDLLTADGIANSSKKADGHGASEFVERYQSALCSFSSLCNELTREKVWGCNKLSEAIRKRPSEFVEKWESYAAAYPKVGEVWKEKYSDVLVPVLSDDPNEVNYLNVSGKYCTVSCASFMRRFDRTDKTVNILEMVQSGNA